MGLEALAYVPQYLLHKADVRWCYEKRKKRENEKKILSAICSHLHSLLPNNKASINADGTLLEQNYMS